MRSGGKSKGGVGGRGATRPRPRDHEAGLHGPRELDVRATRRPATIHLPPRHRAQPPPHDRAPGRGVEARKLRAGNVRATRYILIGRSPSLSR